MQASADHARKYGGTGLGLAICKQLVNCYCLHVKFCFNFEVILIVEEGSSAYDPSDHVYALSYASKNVLSWVVPLHLDSRQSDIEFGMTFEENGRSTYRRN